MPAIAAPFTLAPIPNQPALPAINTTTGTSVQDIINDVTQSATAALGILSAYNKVTAANTYTTNLAQNLSSPSTPSGQVNLLGIALNQNTIWIIVIVALIVVVLIGVIKK